MSRLPNLTYQYTQDPTKWLGQYEGDPCTPFRAPTVASWSLMDFKAQGLGWGGSPLAYPESKQALNTGHSDAGVGPEACAS